MTPQGFVIVAVFLILLVLGFIYDKKKADRIRSGYDKRFNGKHVCDFKNIYCTGFIADDTLVIKERVRGYLIIDLKMVKIVYKSTYVVNATRMANVRFIGENGKEVGDSSKIKQMSPKAADELIEHVLRHAQWITFESYN